MGKLSAANQRLLEGFKDREAEEAKPKKPVAKKAVSKSAVDAVSTKVGSKADQAKALAKPDDALAARAKAAVAAAPQASKEKAPRILPKGFKIPKKLAEVADLFYAKKTERLSYNKTIEELKNIEGALKDELIEKLPQGEASGIAGKTCRVSIKKKDVPRVEDWSKLYASIVKEYNDHVKRKTGQQDGAFALLTRALADSAVQERWDAGKKVDGVTKFTVTDLSVNKL